MPVSWATVSFSPGSLLPTELRSIVDYAHRTRKLLLQIRMPTAKELVIIQQRGKRGLLRIKAYGLARIVTEQSIENIVNIFNTMNQILILLG